MRGRKLIITGLMVAGIVGLTPAPASATPRNLVSNAQFDAVRKGMTLAQVQTALGGKRLYLDFESSSSWPSGGTMVTRAYGRSSSAGDCYQSVTFIFDNVNDSYTALGPMLLESKSRSQFGCEGIVK